MSRQYLGLSASTILIVCGLVGLVGCISVVATDIIGAIVVDSYNPISQTISALAIERKAWIQDVGLNLFAASFAACGVGFILLNLGNWKWRVGSALLFALAADILMISEFDKYADRDGFGSTVHLTCVIILATLFALMLLLTTHGLSKVSRNWQIFNLATAFTWGVMSPIFFVTPNSWNGAYERLISLIVIGWVTRASTLLLDQGRAANQG
ncbi:MAG: DUF998 domain-containing protein [Leptolyngbyaceae cyanobacterium]